METEEKKLTSSEIDQMLEEAAAYHVEPKEPSNKDKKNKKKKKKRKQIRFDIIIAIVLAVVVVVGAVFAISKLAGKSSSASKKSNVENPLEDDKYDEITDVVNNYLNAYLVEDSQKRLDILARYVDNIGDLSESDIAQKKYITSYSEVECYTKNGPYDNTYVVYAYYQTEYKNISTKVPSLTTYYVIRDAKTGNVYIHNKWSDEIKEYISKVSKDADVQKLISDVQKELLEAEKSDANLKKFLDALTGKTEETTTAAQKATQATTQPATAKPEQKTTQATKQAATTKPAVTQKAATAKPTEAPTTTAEARIK
ncbi:hypothetical protein [Eubacterium ventriosum]|uniref:hypothetical protein n=1 Tax=Eubacterium ventriosum TaxID=39496 RepID=UPI00399171CE